MAAAAADAAVKASPLPPPPPPRIIVAVLAFVRFVLAPMLGLLCVARAAAPAIVYLCLATAWVLSAIGTATVVVHLAWGEGSAPFVFVEGLIDAAFKFSICIIFLFLALAAALLCSLCLLYLVAVVSGSGSDFKKSAFGAITWESTHKLLKLPRAVVLGLVADLAFILLSVAGILTMMMSPSGKGSMSQGERIGSVITELGLLGIHATFCFVIIPALARHILREDQVDRKAELVVVVVC